MLSPRERLEAAGWVALMAAAAAFAGVVIGFSYSLAWGIAAALGCTAFFLLLYVSRLIWLISWLDAPSLDGIPDPDIKGIWGFAFERLRLSRQKAEKSTRKLKNRETRYRRTLSSLPDGVVLMKSDWKLDWCNVAAEEQLGISCESDRGRSVPELFEGSALADYLLAGRFEKPALIAARGGELSLEARLIVFGRKNMVLVTHDMTEREQLDAMRRDFVANVSHELRTPLTVVNGFLEIADMAGGGDTVTLERSHLELMREQAGRMSVLVSDLLALSRLEGKADPEADAPVDMAFLIESVLSEGRALSAGRQEITASAEGGPAWIRGSGSEIRSALMNLVSNAVRYTPEGGHIRVGWERRDGGLALSVADDGIGIEPQHIPRLTERFYRVDKSRSRDTGGTGLGLAIVKHVMLRHGGRIDIASEPGQGSVFTMLFPAERESAEQKPGQAEAPAGP